LSSRVTLTRLRSGVPRAGTESPTIAELLSRVLS
jgi:hypothetical protein